jgi:hypothetical protein
MLRSAGLVPVGTQETDARDLLVQAKATSVSGAHILLKPARATMNRTNSAGIRVLRCL